MKLIEITRDGKTYFINPAQISHAEGKEHQESSWIQIHLNESTEGGKCNILQFDGNHAVDIFDKLRNVK